MLAPGWREPGTTSHDVIFYGLDVLQHPDGRELSAVGPPEGPDILGRTSLSVQVPAVCAHPESGTYDSVFFVVNCTI